MKEVINKNVEENKMEIRENKKEHSDIFKIMDKMMDQIEDAMKNLNLLKDRTDTLRKTLDIQPAGIGGGSNQRKS